MRVASYLNNAMDIQVTISENSSKEQEKNEACLIEQKFW
jgi:hypothetical protein